MSTAITAAKPAANAIQVQAGFFNMESFELMQRVSKAFSQSDLVPKNYQGNLANCMIAMDMAQRIGANPLMVMQNLYVVHGTPGWSSKFLVATINACGRYTSLRYEFKGTTGTDEYGCRAWANEKATGERLNGTWITWKMVKAEGWSSKNGSKWLTMPDQMFMYRAAAFWQRSYAPELGMGLVTTEELGDVVDLRQNQDGSYSVDQDKIDRETGEIINATPTLPQVSDEAFAKKKHSWRAIVTNGTKSANQLIAFIEAKEILSIDQKMEIASWEVTATNENNETQATDSTTRGGLL